MDNNISGGMSLPSVLLVIFIVLKLLNIIQWSWVWVLSPFWISLILFLIIAIICMIKGGD